MAVRDFILDVVDFEPGPSGSPPGMIQTGSVTLDLDSMTVTAAQAAVNIWPGPADPVIVNFPVPTGRSADGPIQLVADFTFDNAIAVHVTITLPDLPVDSPRHFKLGANPSDVIMILKYQGRDRECISWIPTDNPYIPPTIALRRFFAGFAVDANGDMPSLQTDDRQRAEQWVQQIAGTCTHVSLEQLPASQTALRRAFEVSGRDDQWDLQCFLTDDKGRADAKQAEMEKTLQAVQLASY
jgi:hypothetical protein